MVKLNFFNFLFQESTGNDPATKTVRRNIFQNMDIVHSSDSEDMFDKDYDLIDDVTGEKDAAHEEELSDLQRKVAALQQQLADKDERINSLEKEKTNRPPPNLATTQSTELTSTSPDCNKNLKVFVLFISLKRFLILI
jgi:hypothetical protein